MFILSYKTRGGAEPTGKQRVFFACHPDDFDRFFGEISDDILTSQNCAIYYIGKEAEKEYEEKTFLSYLSEMRLVVIPVTTNLLTRPSRALDVVYKFAQERHIPVLTLMQEDGLVELYTRTFGDLQFLDKHAKDDTAIPFEKKLADYLSSVLVGDELAEKVRAAFDAYIFLSYRKKDRVHAQELMRLIHKNEFCRDIAIWYDEFLTPGEGFNGSIKAALEKSSLFALAVTPSLLEDGNYVMTEEYPMAKGAGKTILPAEVAATDRKELEAKYEGIPSCTDAHDAPRLYSALLTALEGIAKREDDRDQDHNFMIGLAYLNGVDVEVDVDRALGLITGAAEAGVVEAIKKLVAMYRSGDGVERDYLRAIAWQGKLAALWETRYKESGSDEDGTQYTMELQKLGDYWRELERLSEAKACYEKALGISEAIAARAGEAYARRNLSVGYVRLGDISKAEGRLADAREYYEKSLQINQTLADETKAVDVRRDLSISCSRLGSIAQKEGRLTDARKYYEKSCEITAALAAEMKTVESRRDLSISYNDLGDIAGAEGRLDDAWKYYENALQIAVALAEETKTVESRRDLSIIYDNLGDIAESEGRLADAREYYEKSYEIAAALAKETKTVGSRRDLSLSYERLGSIAQAEGRLDDAREYHESALEIYGALAEETKTVGSRRDLSTSYNCLGDIEKAKGQLDEAREYYEKMLLIVAALEEETKTVESRRRLSLSYERLGSVAEAEGKPAEAREYYEKSLRIDAALAEETETVDSRRDLSISYDRLGDIARAEGRLADAHEYYEKVLEIRIKLADETKTVDSRHDLAASYDRLGDIAESEGRLGDAREYYEKLLLISAALAEETKTIESLRDLSISYNKLGNISKAEGRLDDAHEYYEKSLKIFAALADETRTAQSYDDLAASYYILGTIDYPSVDRNHLQRALNIWEVLASACPGVSEFKRRCDIVKGLLGGDGS